MIISINLFFYLKNIFIYLINLKLLNCLFFHQIIPLVEFCSPTLQRDASPISQTEPFDPTSIV